MCFEYGVLGFNGNLIWEAVSLSLHARDQSSNDHF